MQDSQSAAIIQARMGSTRLPGKVLKPIGGKSMLQRVVERVQRTWHLEDVIVATTGKKRDDIIASKVEGWGHTVFRGSEQDVLNRYYRAATHYEVDPIIRINADCPLADPGVIADAIEQFRTNQPDYASTSIRRTFPLGIGAEVFTYGVLESAWRNADEPYQRSHVTPHIYEHPGDFDLYPVTTNQGDYSHLRWTVDTESDLAFVRAVYDRLSNEHASWTEVLNVLKDHPSLQEINQHVNQKNLTEG